MSGTTRRDFLGIGTAAPSADGGSASPNGPGSGPEAGTVGPADPRYADLVRGSNYRFAGTPDYIRVIDSPGQLEEAVARALGAGKRIAVRSGGHCLEGFPADSEVKVVLDVSQCNDIYFDADRGAIAVESGATLGEVFDRLYKSWGTTVPGGICPQVGVGGHISGGGYGPLSRRFGLVADHLEAVEVVVVDEGGSPHRVVATSSPSDPNHDLWWAHTGGGGGNFGVVSRYWLRSPGVVGRDPAALLPKPPKSLLISRSLWPWSDLDEVAFGRIVNNFIRWHEDNSAPGSAATRLFGSLWLMHTQAGGVMLTVQVDETAGDAESLLADFVAAVTEGTGGRPAEVLRRSMSWGAAWKSLAVPGHGPVVGMRTKEKASYARATYTGAQLAALYKYLTQPDFNGAGASILLNGYGGQVNAVDPAARAVPQRDSVVQVQYAAAWTDPAEDAAQLGWVRGLYRDLFSATGGVPVPGDRADGSDINYPDVDLTDPAWNTSGVPWHALFYKENYSRLQQVKREWDPLNTFRHALSIRP
jgi:hypothetical protein